MALTSGLQARLASPADSAKAPFGRRSLSTRDVKMRITIDDRRNAGCAGCCTELLSCWVLPPKPAEGSIAHRIHVLRRFVQSVVVLDNQLRAAQLLQQRRNAGRYRTEQAVAWSCPGPYGSPFKPIAPACCCDSTQGCRCRRRQGFFRAAVSGLAGQQAGAHQPQRHLSHPTPLSSAPAHAPI